MNSKTVVAVREGGMRFAVRTGSGHQVVVDDAAGNAGPRPTELVLAGLAACTGMDVVSILAKKRQVITEYSVQVLGIQRKERPDVFVRVDVLHVVEGTLLDATAVRRSIELSATKYCPVSEMLCSGTVEMHHRYRILRPGEEPAEGEVVVTGPGARPVVPLTA